MIADNDFAKAPVDVWARIAAPLNPNTIEWRQDGKPINRDGRFLARFVAYVEAGTVRERLDSIVPGEWDLTLSPLNDMVAHEGSTTFRAFKARLQILGVVREDVGEGDSYKSAATDAFKRAAVRFGIGHELYQMEQLWVELDGDGKYAKPVEDPKVAYERKNGKGERSGAPAVAASVPSTRPTTDNAPAAPAPATRQLDEESCPKCGGRTWDNRLTKKNPRAPDFKCRDRTCDGVIWPPNPGEKIVREEGGPGMAWAPLPGAPMIPDDADLPF